MLVANVLALVFLLSLSRKIIFLCIENYFPRKFVLQKWHSRNQRRRKNIIWSWCSVWCDSSKKWTTIYTWGM